MVCAYYDYPNNSFPASGMAEMCIALLGYNTATHMRIRALQSASFEVGFLVSPRGSRCCVLLVILLLDREFCHTGAS